MKTLRESIFDLTKFDLEKKEKQTEFIKIMKAILNEAKEVKLPMQLFEAVFDFDYHRGVKHPIASNIVSMFKDEGLKISKIRNKYLVRIKERDD